jgi:hypothetical protein
MFWVLIYAGNSIETLIFPLIVIFSLGSLFPALFFFAEITITSESISSMIIPPFKKSTKISEIIRVSHRSRLVGAVDAFLISYQSKWGIQRTIGITTSAYSVEVVKEILTILREKNSSIKFDLETEKFLEKSSTKE